MSLLAMIVALNGIKKLTTPVSSQVRLLGCELFVLKSSINPGQLQVQVLPWNLHHHILFAVPPR